MMNIIASLKRILDSSADTRLDMEKIRAKCGPDLDTIGAALGISDMQCVLLSAIFALTPLDGAGMVGLSGGFGCDMMELFILMPDFNALIAKGYVRRVNRRQGMRFYVEPAVVEAFCDNRVPESPAPSRADDKPVGEQPCTSLLDPLEPDSEMLRPVHSHPAKELFFSADVQAQYDELAALLQPDRLSEVQRRLREAGIRSGFTCLFYGPAGTGKTEAVYQLANATGRRIFQADLSRLHDKWVGGSEKNTQQIFDQYFAHVLKCKATPILLLNEADAIVSRRIEGADTTVGMMYNRVQNIILQALEDFQGILIATTNLETNFDPAFERRFLFKMRFTHPDAEVRARLWKSFLPAVADDDCRHLADEFPAFAGGQIVNVGRKVVIDQALHPGDITLQRLRDFCLRESIAPRRAGVGFRI